MNSTPGIDALGVDTGLHGAWAVVGGDSGLGTFGLMPVKNGKCDWGAWCVKCQYLLKTVDVAIVEQPLAITPMSRQSIATTWANYAAVVTGLLAAGFRVVVVRPRTWQRRAYWGVAGKGKQRSFAAARKLLGVKLTHDGVADAALIAWWWLHRRGG
jgi:hypothetical protein